MRETRVMLSVRLMASPSGRPNDAEIAQLAVAIASPPWAATTRAPSTSHTLTRISGSPGTCRARRRSASAAWAAVGAAGAAGGASRFDMGARLDRLGAARGAVRGAGPGAGRGAGQG